MEERINVGDIVTVSMNQSQILLARHAEVLAVPTSPGEPYRFKLERFDFEGKKTGSEIFEVTEGCTIKKFIKSWTNYNET